jgi:hypothetical protein
MFRYFFIFIIFCGIILAATETRGADFIGVNVESEVPEGFVITDFGSAGERKIINAFIRKGMDESLAKEVGDGWLCDEYVQCAKPGAGEILCIWKIAWKTEKDSREFFDAYEKTTNGWCDSVSQNNGKIIWEKVVNDCVPPLIRKITLECLDNNITRVTDAFFGVGQQ